MADNDFRFDAVAGLKETESQKQVKKDIKSFLSNIKIPLIGTLSSKTKAQLIKDIASLNGTVDLTGKVNSKSVSTSLQQATAQAQKQVNAKPIEVSFAVKKEKLVNDIKLLAQQNSKLFKDTDMSIKYNSLLDDASMARNSVELSALRTQLGSLRSELKITGNAGLTFGDSLKKSLSKVMGLFGNFNIIMQFRQQLHNAWIEAEELDKSMTDLSRVNAEITRSGFPDYLDKVISKTKQLAVATKDYIDAVTTFSRAGYNLADSETLADMAVQLEKVGDMSAVDASKALLAGLQGYAEIGGYGMDQLTEKAQALNDKIDKIGNTASLTQKEAAEGIQAVGSVMSDANTSIDEFLALLGAGNRAVQDSDKVALAIRTSALRIRGCTTELEEMGETTDDVIESTSTLAEKIKALTNIDGSGGVNILEEDEETFRSIYDIYNDISKVYDKMSDTDASALLDLIAGKNRSNQISAILQNMSEANELLESSLSASGTASAEYEIYLSSAEAASERFGVAMTETYSNIISGDTVKGLENASAAVLNFANSWGLVEGALKGGLTIGAMKGIANLTVALKNSAVQVSNYGAALEAVNKLGNFAEGTDEYVDKIDKLKTSCSVLTDTQLKQVLAHKNLSDSQLIEILQLKDLEEEQRKARLTQLGLTQEIEEQADASMKNLSIINMLRAAWTKFTAFAAANPMAVGITTIVAATYAAIKASEAWSNRVKKQAQESSNAYKDTLEEIESINSELQSNSQRIDELNAKENLTLVESEELEKLKESNRELENTLALKEKIAQQEKASANKDAVKYFEEDTHTYNNETGKFSSTHIEVATQYLDEIYKKEQRIHELELEMSRTDDKTEKYRELSSELDITQKSYNDLLQRVQDYYDTFTDLDDNLFEGQDDELIQQLDAFYKYMNEVLYGVAETNTDTIRDILAKADFQSASKQLEELGKSGELSIATLSSRFPELIEYLKTAGISAEELYQYIMALSNPGAINYDNVKKQLLYSIGGRQDEAHEYLNEILSLDEEELVLEAYLKVRDQYGEHPEGWTGKDWIANIQSELVTELIEINAQLSISETIDQLNTRLKPTFDSLKSAYQDIFTDDGFTLDSVGVDMLDSIKSSIDDLNSMEGVDINIDSSAFEDFAKVLTDTSSTAEDVQDQFDQLANTIVRATGCTEVNSETFNVLTKSLEEMGLVNAKEVLEEIIQAQEEFQAVSEQLGLTLEEVANATYEETVQMLIEAQAAGQDTQALWQLAVAQGTITDGTIATESNVDALLAEAQAAGLDAAMLTALENVKNGNIKDTNAAQAILEQTRQKLQASMSNFKLDFDFSPAIKSAGKAGSAAGDAYVDAFEKELEELETLRDQGKITEKEYLDYLRKLYEKYFKNIDKYAKNFAENQAKYLQGMKSLYESALSGITSILDKQISAYEDSKSAAVDALEAERDAAIKAKEAEKEHYEQEIKLIDKQIDAKQAEIDAINDAAEARKREIDLQKAQYELERMQNQRTILQYSEDKGMHYVQDLDNVRDAKEEVDSAKREIEIANIEKEIDLLEKQKDLLNEKIDLLDEEIDQINEYYDKLISDTEKYWDNLIKGMEDYKSRWEELAELEEQAKIIETLRSLGIETDDILNMSEEAFAKFKDEYIGILADIYSGNDSMLSALSDTTGRSVDEMGSYITATQGYIDSLSGIGESLNPVAEAIGNVDENMGSLSSTASDANTNITETATSVGNVVSNVGDLTTNLSEVNSLISEEQMAFNNLKQKIDEVIEAINRKTESIREEQNAVGIATSSEMADFLLLKEKILEVKETLESLGTQDEGLINNIATAISSLNDIKLEDGIIGQFTQLKAAIDSVSSAISGDGESSGGEGQGGGSGKGGESGGSGSKGSEGGSGGNSLAGAIESMGKTANEVIGEPDAEGDGTVIGEFGSLETAVSDVTTAIGGGDTEGGEGSGGASGNENDGNLISSIIDLGEATEETLGEPGGDGVIGKFEQFKEPIAEADEHVHSISDGLAAIDGQTVECTIKINIDSDGFPAYASGTALGAMNLESAEYNAKYEGNAHVSGTANVTGNWGVRKPGKSLVGEIGQEIWVHSADGTFETVGDNGPEWIKTEKGDLIFNHLQTKELLDKGNIVKTGKAYANGNIQYSDGTVIRANGDVLEPLQPGDKMYDMLQKFKVYMDSIDNNVEKLSSHITYEHSKQINEVVNQITNSSVVNNNRNVQQPVINGGINITCPGVTSKEVAQQVGVEVDRIFNGMHLEAEQRSRMR